MLRNLINPSTDMSGFGVYQELRGSDWLLHAPAEEFVTVFHYPPGLKLERA